MSAERPGAGSKGGPTPEHANWVRTHPDLGPSAFPDYPDDEARRGSARGAVPNGNPWRAESPDDVPGREGALAEAEPLPVPLPRAAPAAPPQSVAASHAQRALRDDALLGARHIEVLGEGPGIVLLRGRVASREERDRAVAIAASIAGVAAVEDNLEVAGLSELAEP